MKVAMPRIRSIQGKTTFWSGLCLIGTVSALVTYSSISSHNNSVQAAKQTAIASASQQASLVQATIERNLGIATTLALTLSGVKDGDIGLDIGREQANGMLKTALQHNPALTGVFTVWETDAFDEMDAGFIDEEGHDGTGRFAPYWSRTGEDSAVRAVQGYAQGPNSAFYSGPRSTGNPFVGAPRVTKSDAGGAPSITSRLTVPIIAEDEFFGVVGVDLDLSFIQLAAEAIDLYEGTAQLEIISAGGQVLGSTGAAVTVGTVPADRDPETWTTVQATLKNNENLALDKHGYSGFYQPLPIAGMANPWCLIVRIPSSAITEKATAMVWKTTAIGLSLASIAMVFLWLLSSRIARPIAPLLERAARIADGNLGDDDLPVTSCDQLGELTDAINSMSSSLRTVVGRIREGSNVLADSSTDLSSASQDLASGAESTALQSASVATASEQLSASTRNMADSAGRMSENAKQVVLSSEQMTTAIVEMTETAEGSAAVAEKAASLSEKSTQRIAGLGQAAEEIGKVIEVIREIAGQTNLLALNATIEAARAGDAGRGFAVVADEVKALADQTAASTDEVQERIEVIQTATLEAVASIQETGDAIRTANELSQSMAHAVEEQSVTVKDIARSIKETAGLVQDVTEGLEQSSFATQEIAEGIAKVDVSAREAQSQSGKVRSSSTDLSELATRFEDLLAGFTIRPAGADPQTIDNE